MTKRILLKIEYEGTAYHGWQIQPNGLTVEELLENALQTIFRKAVNLNATSRTDAGVHALGQVAYFDIDEHPPLYRIQKSLNALTPRDITVVDIKEVDKKFYPRQKTIGKRYRYQITNSLSPAAIHKDYCWWVREPLDIEKMRLAAEDLLGEHDFGAFQAKGCQALSTIKKIHSISFQDYQFGAHRRIDMVIKGNSFLKYMVRIITGTLVDIGTGKISGDTIKQGLEKPKRAVAGMTAPPQGLFLEEIYFPEDPFQD